MWKVKGDDASTRNANLQLISMAFDAIDNNIPGLIRMEYGVNIINVPDAWDLALHMVFESRQALDDYLASPEHINIKKIVEPIKLAKSQVDFSVYG